ncbi:MAG: hypothetical protein SFV54_18165 [Bryobacteraceae bacterium]|nr:hypothetical protein [Bryobacteraceae bacterium]
MADCPATLERFRDRDFRDWHGLPPCRWQDAASLFTPVGSGPGSGRLGNSLQRFFRVVETPGYARTQVWLDGDSVIAVEGQRPRGAVDTSGLGEPDAKLDAAWDVLSLAKGEHVWASRGLSILSKPNGTVLRVMAFAPVPLREYIETLRPISGSRERPYRED